jgi:hypothetical protein
VSVTCLNLPAGASCSYSATTGIVSISTSSTTPAGTYQITVVFHETLPGAATTLIVLPTLLLPFAIRRKWKGREWFMLLLAGVVLSAVAIGCGGSSQQTGGGSPPTHQVTSSGTVNLTIQ